MPASSGTDIQTPTSTNLKQYNAAQPDASCTTTIDMPASQPCSSTLTYQQSPPAFENHHAIQNQTSTSQHSNHHLHHTSHSEYSTLHPAICPHKCIRIIFLPNHHQTMEQPTTCHNQQHNLDKHCNPHQHPVGAGQHCQLRLGGHLTLTSIMQQPTHQHPVGVGQHCQLPIWVDTSRLLASYNYNISTPTSGRRGATLSATYLGGHLTFTSIIQLHIFYVQPYILNRRQTDIQTYRQTDSS